MADTQKIDVDKNPDKYDLSPKIRQAIASLRLEGITLDPKSLADLELFSQKRMSKEEVIQRALASVKNKAS